MNFNSVIDRALSEHIGSGLYNKKENGKYSLFMPVENLGELGSSPEQIEKTVIGNMARSYIQGRKDSPQQSITIHTHRDNLRILKSYQGKTIDFLRLFPDFSGVKYSGTIDRSFNDTPLDGKEEATVSITITIPEEVIDDCYDLLEDTAIFTNDIPANLVIEKGKSEKINISTNPGDATVTAKSETDSVAGVQYEGGVATITGTTAGSAVIIFTVSKEGYASWQRSIHVIVTDSEGE